MADLKYSLEEIDALQRLRRAGTTMEKIVHFMDTMDRVDRDHEQQLHDVTNRISHFNVTDVGTILVASPQGSSSSSGATSPPATSPQASSTGTGSPPTSPQSSSAGTGSPTSPMDQDQVSSGEHTSSNSPDTTVPKTAVRPSGVVERVDNNHNSAPQPQSKSSVDRRHRYRFTFPDECITIMEKFFQKNQYPDQKKREEITIACNRALRKPGEELPKLVTSVRVYNWFANRRKRNTTAS